MLSIICKTEGCCFNGNGACLLQTVSITEDGSCGNIHHLEPQEIDALRRKFKMESHVAEVKEQEAPQKAEVNMPKVEAPPIVKDEPKPKLTEDLLENMYIQRGMNIDDMAKELGMARSTLYAKLSRLGLTAKSMSLEPKRGVLPKRAVGVLSVASR